MINTTRGPVNAADRLKAELKKNAITVTQLADHLGISRQAIYGWIKRGAISPSHIADTAALLCVSPSWLAFGNAQDQINGEDCHLNCSLKSKLIEILLQSNELIVEHNIAQQTLIWHGNPASTFGSQQAPADTPSLLQWIDNSYLHMFHDALLSYHLYQTPQKLIFPITHGVRRQLKKEGSVKLWFELQFHTHCNQNIVLYSLTPARMEPSISQLRTQSTPEPSL